MNIFGVDSDYENSQVILLPVPWEVTTSYGAGAALGPQNILAASDQVDLFDTELGNAYQKGYYMSEVPQDILTLNNDLKNLASTVRENPTPEVLRQVNEASETINSWVYEQCQKFLNDGKLVGLIGGDHSTPYGYIQALSEKYKGEFGILHIDAHLDLREAYQGFTHSHASIMWNVLNLPQAPQKLVQFGIRDFCEEEFQITQQDSRVETYFDIPTQEKLLSGDNWLDIITPALQNLPDNVYISFDIDGLDPALCPNTGTPVPGGLSFQQVLTLFSTLHKLNKKIIGFDLVEVTGGPQSSEWDGNVGMRLLFKLCGWTLKTNNKL